MLEFSTIPMDKMIPSIGRRQVQPVQSGEKEEDHQCCLLQRLNLIHIKFKTLWMATFLHFFLTTDEELYQDVHTQTGYISVNLPNKMQSTHQTDFHSFS